VIQKVLLLLLPLLFLSCKETSNGVDTKKETKLIFEPTFKGLSAFLNYQEKVDARQDLKRLPSLFFTHKSAYTIKSEALLDTNGEILKASLEKIDPLGHKVQYTFYFLKEVLSMVLVNKSNMRSSTLRNHCTFVFYNANQSPIASYAREVINGKQVPFKAIKSDKKTNSDIDNALQMLSQMQNQNGAFTLYFQGFDEAFNKKFVQFGNDEYSSNLAYAPNDTSVLAFEKNPNSFRKQTFSIQFQDVQEASGLQYQVLTAIQNTNATFYWFQTSYIIVPTLISWKNYFLLVFHFYFPHFLTVKTCKWVVV